MPPSLSLKERVERRKRSGGGGKPRKPSDEGGGGGDRLEEVEVDGWVVPTPRNAGEEDILVFTNNL